MNPVLPANYPVLLTLRSRGYFSTCTVVSCGWVAGFLFNILVEMSQALRNGFLIFCRFINTTGMAAGNAALPSSLWLKVSQWDISPWPSFCFHKAGTPEDSPSTSSPFFVYTILSHGFFNFFFFKSKLFNLSTIDIQGWMFSVSGILCALWEAQPHRLRFSHEIASDTGPHSWQLMPLQIAVGYQNFLAPSCDFF